MSKLPVPQKKKKPPRRGMPRVAYKYKEEFCEMLVAHMAKGYSYESFAHEIDVHRDTLFAWEKDHEKWAEFKEKAYVASLAWWERKLISAIEDGQPFNTTAYIFTMKSRFRIGNDTSGTSVKTLVQVRNGNQDPQVESGGLVQDFEQIFVAHLNERKEPAGNTDR